MTVVARTTASPTAVFAEARAAVRELDPDLPLFELSTLERRFLDSAARPRLYMALLMSFATVAVMLAAIGLYGVVSYAVRQQRHELGVRIALGASRLDVVRLVIGGSLKVTTIGVVSGVAGAVIASRALRALLYGISATDPWTYGAVVLLILSVGVLASWLPARRATAIDPASALRSD